MFWSAVGGGLAELGHWQVWVGALAVALLMLGFQLAVARMMSKDELAASGCLTFIIGGTVLQGLLETLYFAFVLPLLLDSDQAMPIGVLAEQIFLVVKVALFVVLASVAVSFLPIPKPAATAASTFVAGVVACRLLLAGALEDVAARGGARLEYPGVWASIGFLLIAWILSVIVIFAVSVAGVGMRSAAGSGEAEEPSVLLLPVMQAMGTLAGFVPVFMYMNYAVQQVRT